MVLRQVLQLDNAPGPATRPVRAVEREHPPGAPVGADGILHGAVLAYGCLGKLLTTGQGGRHILIGIGQQVPDCFLVQGLRLDTLAGEPALHLYNAVGVFQSCSFPHPGTEGLFRLGVNGDGLADQRHVYQDAPVVDFLVEVVLIPDEIRDGEFCQPCFDSKFHYHIPDVVFFEQIPFLWGVVRKVPGAPAVLLGGAAGLAEIFDKVGAFLHLLLVQFQYRAHAFE